jgi:TPP-dependent pyruvate/acetoin dehydrogenase alpha subunit
MPKEKLEHHRSKDPVDIGRRYRMERGGADEAEVGAIEAEVEREMEEAVRFAEESPEPSVEQFFEEVASYS